MFVQGVVVRSDLVLLFMSHNLEKVNLSNLQFPSHMSGLEKD